MFPTAKAPVVLSLPPPPSFQMVAEREREMVVEREIWSGYGDSDVPHGNGPGPHHVREPAPAHPLGPPSQRCGRPARALSSRPVPHSRRAPGCPDPPPSPLRRGGGGALDLSQGGHRGGGGRIHTYIHEALDQPPRVRQGLPPPERHSIGRQCQAPPPPSRFARRMFVFGRAFHGRPPSRGVCGGLGPGGTARAGAARSTATTRPRPSSTATWPPAPPARREPSRQGSGWPGP